MYCINLEFFSFNKKYVVALCSKRNVQEYVVPTHTMNKFSLPTLFDHKHLMQGLFNEIYQIRISRCTMHDSLQSVTAQ